MRKLRFLFSNIGLALFLLGLAPVGASSANISHSYNSTASISNGSLVSLDPARSNYVVPANNGNSHQMIGVASASNDSLLAIDAEDGKVQVATSGTVSALVTNLNGNISVGDQIAATPFNGIGAKATPGVSIIGVAQTAFNGSTEGAQQQAVTDKAGHSRQLILGYIRLNLGTGTSTAANGSQQLDSLQKLGRSLTGHPVATSRIVISMVIALVALLAVIILVYSTIYSGIISIGRNPLAKHAVMRTVSAVLGMAVLVAIIAALTIFFILR